MSEKFNNRYRTNSFRLKRWDYRSNGSYFITICTKNRKHYFGEISTGRMYLTDIGKLAEQFWFEIPEHFPHAKLGNFVVMPNHIHGVIIIENKWFEYFDHSVNRDDDRDDIVETLQCNVSTISSPATIEKISSPAMGKTIPSTKPQQIISSPKNKKMSQISPKPGSISTIIRSYKSVVTKHSKQYMHDFAWQPRFHDHMIRNESSFQNIQNYIVKNPLKWAEDRFY